jgi:hypothetical protein
MRNEALQGLDGLVGEWTLTLSHAWFLESMDTEIRGSATIEWLADAFLVFRAGLGEQTAWDFVIGRSDANDAFTVLYHDERGVSRVFAMTFGDGEWTLFREDPDFHQRFLAKVEPDRITAQWDASEDKGQSWRKDFDLVFVRA